MSKPSSSKAFFPAVWIVAVAAIAVVVTVSARPTKSGWQQNGATIATVPPSSQSFNQPLITPAERARVRATYAALPLAFEANEGQTDAQVKYMARGNGYTLFLTSGDAVLSLVSASAKGSFPKQVMEQRLPGYSLKTKKLMRRRQARSAPDTSSVASIRFHVVDGNPAAPVVGDGLLPSRVNYYIGNNPRQWHQGVSEYARVAYKDVYPGVSLAYHGHQNQVEFDFIVAAGASTAPIALAFPGTKRVAKDNSGNLVLASRAGDMTLHQPIAYQDYDGMRKPVAAQFVLQSNNQVRFEVGRYDHNRELIIDPYVSYATYLGGNAEDVGFGIALDSSLNTYVTGHSDSTSGFPGGNPSNGGFDAFIVKIKPDGTLGYTTFFGGSSDDLGAAIAVDSSGAAYVTGITTSTDFPATGGAQSTAGSPPGSNCTGGGAGSGAPCTDAFAFKVDSTGARVYGTYIGGNDFDDGFGIAVDGSGHAYVTGDTFSATGFPLVNAFDNSLNKGAGVNASDDAFVTEVSANGSAFVYSSYLGGTLTDLGNAIVVDSAGDAYVVGETFSPDFPSTNGSVCGTDGNCNFDGSFYYFDAFVTEIAPLGTSVLKSGFLGGSSDDFGFGIAVDGSGNVYVAGVTTFDNPFAVAPDFPTVGPFEANYGGGSGNTGASANGFVSKINPTFSTLVYSSYLGGSTFDVISGLALDSTGNVYVTGTTLSTDFPTTNGFQTALNGTSDAFVTEVNPSGSAIVYSSYLGGSGNENFDTSNNSAYGGAITVDPSSGNAYLAGGTTSTDFPVTAGAPEKSYGGNPFDAFAATVAAADFTIGATTPAPVSPGSSGTSTVTLTALNSYSQSVTLTCSVTGSGSPAPSCSASSDFSTNPVTPTGGGATSTLTITTTGKMAALHRTPSIFYAMWLPVVGLSLIGMRFSTRGSRKKKMLGFLLLGMVMTMLFFLPACGGGSGGGGGGCTGCTPAGNYTVTITGTDANNLSHSTQVTLTVN